MVLPELTEEQRIESFMKDRLSNLFRDNHFKKFSKKELAEFCLKEIDYAIDLVDSVDESDFESDDDDAEHQF